MKTVSVGKGLFALKFDYEKKSYRIAGMTLEQCKNIQNTPGKKLFDKYFKDEREQCPA